MKREVLLTIVSEQTLPSGEKDSSRMEVNAEYFEKNGGCYLMYEEMIQEGESIKSHLKWKGHQVEITRKGTLNSQMLFQRGLDAETHYGTPFGEMRFLVCTDDVTVDESEEEIKIALRYRLANESEIISHNKIDFLIRGR